MQHDGAPPHYALCSRQVMNEIFDEKWIGRGDHVAWPPRSPDLTSPDTWFHLKKWSWPWRNFSSSTVKKIGWTSMTAFSYTETFVWKIFGYDHIYIYTYIYIGCSGITVRAGITKFLIISWDEKLFVIFQTNRMLLRYTCRTFNSTNLRAPFLLSRRVTVVSDPRLAGRREHNVAAPTYINN